MAQVKFLPSDQSVEVEEEQSLLSAALQAGIAIATACGGVANCTECKIEVLEGEEHLSEMEYIEESKLGNVFYITHVRLACQTHVQGPVTVRVIKEELPDKRARSRQRALRRAKENLARKAGRTSDEVRRRLALLNDDGEGAQVEARSGGRTPRPPRPAGPARGGGESGPPRGGRRRRPERSSTPADSADAPPRAAQQERLDQRRRQEGSSAPGGADPTPQATAAGAEGPDAARAEGEAGDRPKRRRRRRRRRPAEPKSE